MGLAGGSPYEEVSERLRPLGITGLRHWAELRGFPRTSVYNVVRVWWPRRKERPLGGVSRQIMAALLSDVEQADRLARRQKREVA